MGIFLIIANMCKVDTGGSKRISRGTIDYNEGLLTVVIDQVGSRVGVDTLYFHIEALYKIMKLPADSILSVIGTECLELYDFIPSQFKF